MILFLVAIKITNFCIGNNWNGSWVFLIAFILADILSVSFLIFFSRSCFVSSLFNSLRYTFYFLFIQKISDEAVPDNVSLPNATEALENSTTDGKFYSFTNSFYMAVLPVLAGFRQFSAKMKIYAHLLLLHDIYRYRHSLSPHWHTMKYTTHSMRHIYEFLYTDTFIDMGNCG